MRKRPRRADREQARRDAAWLRELAERGYEELDRRGQLTIRRQIVSADLVRSNPRRAEREQGLADAAWLRALAERGKAELDRRADSG